MRTAYLTAYFANVRTSRVGKLSICHSWLWKMLLTFCIWKFRLLAYLERQFLKQWRSCSKQNDFKDLEQVGGGAVRQASKQCDQIWQNFATWSKFKSLWEIFGTVSVWYLANFCTCFRNFMLLGKFPMRQTSKDWKYSLLVTLQFQGTFHQSYTGLWKTQQWEKVFFQLKKLNKN